MLGNWDTCIQRPDASCVQIAGRGPGKGVVVAASSYWFDHGQFRKKRQMNVLRNAGSEGSMNVNTHLISTKVKSEELVYTCLI